MKREIKTIEVSAVRFRDDLYPRIEKNPALVAQYAEDLDTLPPIEINQRNELIDGWHRWTAYKKTGAETIPVFVTETQSDIHLYELAIERNATHGLALNAADKKEAAVKIYLMTSVSERWGKRKDLARILGVSEATLSGMLSRTDKEERERRNRRIRDWWLQYYTQQEIAEREGISKGQINEICSEFSDLKKLNKSEQAAAEHATEFEPPIYNIWKQQIKTGGIGHPGNTEIRWVDNLLYLYTEPFDVVVDPFAGSGSTLDICRKRWRRCWLSDHHPIVEREEEIRRWDVLEGLPPLSRWKDVKLVYLDPPYWKQAAGKYTDDPVNLANMSLDKFESTVADLILAFAQKLSPGSHIALVMQPTQWNAPNRRFTDHITAIISRIELALEIRISCPYESQQCNAQMVDWAKENKKTLVLTREITVWRI